MRRKINTYMLVCIMAFLAVVGFYGCNATSVAEFPSFEDFRSKGAIVDASICTVKNGYQGIVTVISDDGYYESGVILNELAKEFNLNVTVAGAVRIIKPNLHEWQRIEKEGKVDLVSHSYSHIKVAPDKNLTNEQVLHEYLCAKEWYEKYFISPSFTIVAPENITTAYGFSVWKEMGILAARLGARGGNPLKRHIEYGVAQGQWLNLRMRGLYDADDTAGRNAWIDAAIKNETWLIEMWHDISPEGNTHFQPITTVKAREHLKYISEQQQLKKIWAASFTQAVSYLYQRDYGSVEAYKIKDSIAVVYKRMRQDLPWDDFNVPVTVKIPLGSSANIKQVCTENESVKFERVNDGILFDLPTDGTVVYLK